MNEIINKWNVISDCRNLDEQEIINNILDNRGITSETSLLYPLDEYLIPHEKLLNIQKAYAIIQHAINHHQKITVFADTDVDGCTSGAIMYRYLQHFTDNIAILINADKTHGLSALDVNKLNDTQVLIIVDSINEQAELYQALIDKGIKIIVLDHHIIPDTIHNVDITLVSSANNYPNSELSGAGVVWKFCDYIDRMTLCDYADDLVDLACCGIIADMSNVDYQHKENRYICLRGMNNLQNTAIKEVVGGYAFDGQSISYSIAPLVNSACRTQNSNLALQLFLSDDRKEVKNIIAQLKQLKEKQNQELQEWLPLLTEQYEQQKDNNVLFFIIDTQNDISGVLANKLLSIYQRPVFVLRKGENSYRGSMRAIGIENFKQYVDKISLCFCGGHENAAGVEIPFENYDQFQTLINQALQNVTFENKIDIDVQLNENQITTSLIQYLKNFNKVTGTAFPPVNVAITNIDDYNVSTMSNGKHLKITTQDISYIQWNYIGDISALENKCLSFVGSLQVNYFGGKANKQLIIQDLQVINNE